MTTAAAAAEAPSMSSPLVQATHRRLDDTKKRPRPKTVTWSPQDKLNQVRLFAAEDAPSLSGLVLQDLLEAKKTKFMHALVPVSADDLPPGFEGVATKRARLDTAAILAMVAQITWRFPERFWHDPSWQVAVGDESSDVNVQRQREVRVLEAVYPRPSAIPPSSMEPHEEPPDFGDLQVPEIPLIPTEDEEDGMEEEDDLSGGTRSSNSISPPLKVSMSGDEASLSYPPGYSPSKDAQSLTLKSQSKGGSSSAAAQFNSDLTMAFFKNADPDVAAAAAAAYAVLKAKESGALIDHELLIKILSNPLLIKTLTASHPSLKIQLGDTSSSTSSTRENSNGNGLKMRGEPFGEGSLLRAASSLSSFIMQGRQRYDSSEGNSIMQGWSSNASGLPTSQGRGYPMAGAHEMLGQARGAYSSIGPPGRLYPVPRQDLSRELIHQHGMAGMIINEAQSRQSVAPMAFDEVMLGHDLERYSSSTVPGSKGLPWLGINSNAPLSAAISRSNLAPQERLGGSKIRKQCFFFNTPRGCRNGIYCNYLHEAAPEKLLPERTHHDGGQEMKFARGDPPDAEAK